MYLVLVNTVCFMKIVSVTSSFRAFLWKGIVYGRRGNKLDLYYPPKMNKSKDERPSLVVFIYGGAWTTGHRSIYCLLARQMAEELNAAVVCPDYSTYPKVRNAPFDSYFCVMNVNERFYSGSMGSNKQTESFSTSGN